MDESNAAYAEFQSLWQRAINPNKNHQMAEVNCVVKDLPVLSLLEQFSLLAECLENSNAISAEQRQQMQTSVSNMENVLQAVDPQKLSEALKSTKAI